MVWQGIMIRMLLHKETEVVKYLLKEYTSVVRAEDLRLP